MARNRGLLQLRLGKKGVGEVDLLQLFLKIGIISLVFLGVIMILNKGLTLSVDSFPIEKDIFFHRLLYSKGGISYYDTDTGRVDAGIIDYDRISNNPKAFQKSLEDAISYAHPIGAMIKINGQSKNLDEIVLYYHKQDFEKAMVYHGAGLIGKSSAYYDEKIIPILIRSDLNGIFEKGIMRIQVTMPKSLKLIQ